MVPMLLRSLGIIAVLAVAHYFINFGLLVLSFGGAMVGLDTGAAPTPLEWLATLLYPVFTFPAYAFLQGHPSTGFDLLLLAFTSVLWAAGIFVLGTMVRNRHADANRTAPMRALGIVVLFALCGCAAAPRANPASPGDEFLQVVQAVKTDVAGRGWGGAEDVQIDVRPLRNDARSAGPGAFIDDPETDRLRSNILARERIPLGDLEVAERCNYLGTMRRLILEPASPEELRLVEFCRGVFRGLTLGVSLPSEAANGERRYRVLAMGDNKELIMDILIRPGVEAAEVRIVPQFSF